MGAHRTKTFLALTIGNYVFNMPIIWKTVPDSWNIRPAMVKCVVSEEKNQLDQN